MSNVFNRGIAVFVIATALASWVRAAEPATSPVEEIRLTVHPAAPPVPAMRYHFLTDVVEQVPGNAALLDLAAAQQMAAARGEPANNPPGTDDEKIDRWLNTPARDLPHVDVRALRRSSEELVVSLQAASIKLGLRRPTLEAQSR